MDQLQMLFDMIHSAVNDAISSGNYEKLAYWFATVFTGFYCLIMAANKGFTVASFSVHKTVSGYKKLHSFLFPPPPDPPAPSYLCRHLLDVLKYENMIYDRSKGDMLCGPVMIKLIGTTIKDITVDKDHVYDHLTSLDFQRVSNRVEELVQTDTMMKQRDAVQRMVGVLSNYSQET